MARRRSAFQAAARSLADRGTLRGHPTRLLDRPRHDGMRTDAEELPRDSDQRQWGQPAHLAKLRVPRRSGLLLTTDRPGKSVRFLKTKRTAWEPRSGRIEPKGGRDAKRTSYPCRAVRAVIGGQSDARRPWHGDRSVIPLPAARVQSGDCRPTWWICRRCCLCT